LAATLIPHGATQDCSPTYPPQPADGVVPDGNSERVLRVSLDGNDEDIDSTLDGTGLSCGDNQKGPSHPWISDDGDRIVYSAAPVALPGVPFSGNTSQMRHVFLRVVSAGASGETHLISGEDKSLTTAIGMENPLAGGHDFPRMSGDGEWITWAGGSGAKQLFLHEVDAQSTTVISEAVAGPNDGQAANGACQHPFVSEDGRYIVFESKATNLHDQVLGYNFHGYVPVGGCPGISPDGATWDVYLLDRGDPAANPPEPASITWISVGLNAAGECSAQPGGSSPEERDSVWPTISANACYVAFQSAADNLTPLGNPLGNTQIYLRDTSTGDTFLVSKTHLTGDPGDGNSGGRGAMISRDGNWVVFDSEASDLVLLDTNGHGDVFVWSRQTEDVRRVSLDSNGNEIDEITRGVLYPFISGNGRFVFFTWPGAEFNGPGTGVDGVGNPLTNPFELYVHDRDHDSDGAYDDEGDGYDAGEVRTIRISDVPGANPTSGGNHLSGGNVCASVDGRFVAYMSRASDFVDAMDVGGVDTNGDANCSMCANGPGHSCPAWQGRDIFRREMYVVSGGQ